MPRTEALPCPPLRKLVIRVFLLITALFFSALAFARTSGPAADSGIVFFEGDWKAVQAEAARSGKPIFVDAYASWCGPCKMLARNVFPDPKVGAFFNASFINWHIDMETPEGELFGATHPVEAYPTLFFFDKNGKQIKKKTGYREADDLLNLARLSLHPESDTAMKAWNDRFSKGERSRSFLYAYIYALAQNDEDFEAVFNLVNSSLTETELENDTAFLLFCMNDMAFDSKLGTYFSANYARFEKAHGEKAQDKARKFLNAGFNEILESKDKKRLAALKGFARNIWKGDELAELLKSIDEEYEKAMKG